MLHSVERSSDLNITKPHQIEPYPFGLFSVASVSEYTEAQDHWARYTAHEYNSRAFKGTLLSTRDATAYTLSDTITAGITRFLEYIPFAIEIEDYASTFGINAQDRFKRSLDILDGITQKAVERELWEGDCAKIGTGTSGSPTPNANNYLTKTGSATNLTVTSAGDNPRLALANLENALATCPLGQRGTLHMSHKVASILTGVGLLERIDFSARLDRKDVNGQKQALVTLLGTPVVVGSGYTGNGPVGTTGATATAGAEWIFATGLVDAHLGASRVINEDLARAVAPNTNDAHIRAARTAAVHFEPCCHYTARVDLSTINNF